MLAPSPEPSKPVETQPPRDKEEAEELCMYGLDTMRLRQRSNNPFSVAQLRDSSSFSSLYANDFFDTDAALSTFSIDPPPFSTRIGFHIPLSASLASFYNVGNLSYSIFTINATSVDDPPQFDDGIRNKEGREEDDKEPTALVEIVLSYYTQEAVDKSKVCYFRDGNKRTGVNIVVRCLFFLYSYCT